MRKIIVRDCPLKKSPINIHQRMQSLSDLENVFSRFFILFAQQVEKSYSDQERKLLIRIIKLLELRIEGEPSKPILSCKYARCDLIRLLGTQNYFHLALPEGRYPFCIAPRTDYLHELAGKLSCFFANLSSSCSVRERQALCRIRKILIHQLKGTPDYDLFKAKRKPRITKEEKEELRRQRIDEKRMRFTKPIRYNPLSRKYKKKKEEFLRRLEEGEL